jgi:hypothetical protein
LKYSSAQKSSKLIQKETNWYANQQINKKKQEGPLKPKSVFAQWNAVSIQDIDKLFSIIIHMSMLCKSSLQDYWSFYPLIQTPCAASVGMSWDTFKLLSVFHLNNSNAKAGRCQPDCNPLFTIWPVIDTLITKFQYNKNRTKSWLTMRQYAHFKGIYSFVFVSKESLTNIE